MAAGREAGVVVGQQEAGDGEAEAESAPPAPMARCSAARSWAMVSESSLSSLLSPSPSPLPPPLLGLGNVRGTGCGPAPMASRSAARSRATVSSSTSESSESSMRQWWLHRGGQGCRECYSSVTVYVEAFRRLDLFPPPSTRFGQHGAPLSVWLGQRWAWPDASYRSQLSHYRRQGWWSQQDKCEGAVARCGQDAGDERSGRAAPDRF